jgi:pimeloyl-ACP methyl ester carboxylesterase
VDTLLDLERKELRLPQGTIRYRDSGGDGPPLVFVHGLLVNGDFWRGVAPPLAADHRCLVPDLPLGGHRSPFPADADLSLPGLARLVADFLAALDLRDVTLVGNDSGGGICQVVVARHPERVTRLVLTNCDAFENTPPPILKPLVAAARLPPLAALIGRSLRWRPVQRALYRLVARRFPAPPVAASYFSPLTDPGARRDVLRMLASLSNKDTLDAARTFPSFPGPVLIVWAPADRLLFPLRYGERLRDAFPHARLETVADSLTFIPEDQPERLASFIAAFLGGRRAAAA